MFFTSLDFTATATHQLLVIQPCTYQEVLFTVFACRLRSQYLFW